jgi:hypothetical protein
MGDTNPRRRARRIDQSGQAKPLAEQRVAGIDHFDLRCALHVDVPTRDITV